MTNLIKQLTAGAAAIGLALASQAAAASVSLGARVTTGPDAIATFDDLATMNMDATTYTEGDLAVRSSGTTFTTGFDAFGFGVSETGIYYVQRSTLGISIFSESGKDFKALDLLFGDGNTGFGCCRAGGQGPTRIAYEIERDGVIIDSGVFDTIVGTIFAVTDAAGFDLVRIGVGPNISMSPTEFANSAAIDNVFVDYLDPVVDPVPVPAAALLFAPVLGGLVMRRRRAQS
ncbi:MAG: hypothetical protein HRU11_03525 [Parvularculaceae bacterium]|nr:hypothetical protein [Parvularculaceae bacterium]